MEARRLFGGLGTEVMEIHPSESSYIPAALTSELEEMDFRFIAEVLLPVRGYASPHGHR